MKLSIFNNSANGRDSAPYVLSVDLAGHVIPPDTHYHIPIYLDRAVGADERSAGAPNFNVEICGFRLEAEDPENLFRPAAELLDGLINMARLPTYIFAAGRSMLIYPVYTVEDEVFATTPGGPVFRHVELAKVRRYLSDYLHTMEELGTVGRAETLHVRGVDSTTLGLMRPVFYLKKRVVGENEFWAPVFRSPDGRTVYTYAASARRETLIRNGLEVLDLQAIVADALIADQRLQDPPDLRPDRLFPGIWQQLQMQLIPQPYRLSYPGHGGGQNSGLTLYRYGKSYLAAEHRQDEDRYNLFLGKDPLDLRARVAQELLRRALITANGDVELMTA
jgi:hypothetical protein